jgi:hypothetical protein
MTKPMMMANFLLAVVLCLPVLAAAQNTKAPLTNDDVVQMVSNGLPENVVIGALSANDVNFDVSTSGLVSLKKAGVGDRVVEAMLAVESKKRVSAAPQVTTATQLATPSLGQEMYRSQLRAGATGLPTLNLPTNQAPAQLPEVTLIVEDKKQPMRPSVTEIAQGKGKGGPTAGGVLKGFGKGLMMAGTMAGAPLPRPGGGVPRMPGAAYTWALPGRTSAFSIPSRSLKFEIEFGDIPGVDPDAYEPVVVKLIQTKDNWRLVSFSKDKFDKHGNDTRSVKTEAKTPLNITILGRGHLELSPATELPPGEYGLVLHPKKALKEFAGVPAANTEAIFSSVWDFSVGAANR